MFRHGGARNCLSNFHPYNLDAAGLSGLTDSALSANAQTFASYRGTLAPMTDFTVCYWINFHYHHR